MVFLNRIGERGLKEFIFGVFYMDPINCSTLQLWLHVPTIVTLSDIFQHALLPFLYL